VATTTLTGTTGNDILNAPGSVTTLVSGIEGNDTITLVLPEDQAVGGAGNDVIQIAQQAALSNTINAGAGDDTVQITSAVSFVGSVAMGDGADSIYYTAGTFNNATFGGNAGNDLIRFDATILTSTIGGGAGNDSIAFTGNGGVTNAQILGGKNRDTINFSNAAAYTTTTVQSGDGHDELRATAGHTLTNTIFATGKGYDSIYLGTAAFNTVVGGQLNDTIVFASTAVGGGVFFADSLGETVGGTNAGNDLISFSAVTSAVDAITVYGAGGNDTVTFGASVFQNSALRFELGDGADVFGNSGLGITGGGTATFIGGGAGHDTIKFNSIAGLGTIDGGAGNDSIYVGAVSISADAVLTGVSINGGAGNDVIAITSLLANSGLTLGAVTVNGGTGADTIKLNTYAGNSAGLSSDAILANVVFEDGDKILLGNTLAQAQNANWLAATQIYVLSAATAMSAVVATGGATALGSIGVWSTGTDLNIWFVGGDSTQVLVNVIGGSSLLINNTAGAQTLGASNFGFEVGLINNAQVQITL